MRRICSLLGGMLGSQINTQHHHVLEIGGLFFFLTVYFEKSQMNRLVQRTLKKTLGFTINILPHLLSLCTQIYVWRGQTSSYLISKYVSIYHLRKDNLWCNYNTTIMPWKLTLIAYCLIYSLYLNLRSVTFHCIINPTKILWLHTTPVY